MKNAKSAGLSLATFLKTWRSQKKFSQEEAAKHFGDLNLSVRTWEAWEGRRNFSKRERVIISIMLEKKPSEKRRRKRK